MNIEVINNVTLLLFKFWFIRIQSKYSLFDINQDVASLGYEGVSKITSDLWSFFFLFIGSLALLSLTIIFMASIIKGVIWPITTGTRLSLTFLSKFFILNLIWMGFWFLLIFLFSLIIEPLLVQKINIFVIFVSLYLSNILYSLFVEQNKIGKILDAFKIGFTKIHFFILPCALIFLIFYIFINISRMIVFSHSFYLNAIIALFLAAWMRYYIWGLILEIQKKKFSLRKFFSVL